MTEHVDLCLCEACLEKQYEEYKHACVHELMVLNEKWLAEFKIGDWPRWDYELESSTLTFSDEGEARVVADIQVVGTVQGVEWEWSWGNITLPAKCRSRMAAVKASGEGKNWSKLTSLFQGSDDHLGWEFTAVSAHILCAKGGYRCPDEQVPGNFLYTVVLDSRFIN